LDGKLKTLKDANAGTTTYYYDTSNWLTKTVFPDGSYEEYAPDSNSNILTKRTRKGDIITYSYDNLNRMASKACPSYPAVTYAYDIASRLTSVIAGGSAATSYIYDNLNRTIQVTYPGAKYVSYEYDKASNRLKLTYPDGTYIAYTYDQLNRLQYIKDQSNNTVSGYSYDPLSRRTGLHYLNGTNTEYSYDNLDRLLDKVNKKTMGAVISGFAYTYDNAGNRRTMDETRGTSAPVRTNYDYDNVYRVTNVTYPSGNPFAPTAYSYDPVGNRTQVQGDVTDIYSSNILNQYTQVNQTAYTYDGNGNLTSDGASTYSYDYENRLTAGTVPARGLSLSYTYDPLGRRIQKSVNGQATSYIYDGDQIIAEYNGSGVLTKKFIYGPGIDEPICLKVIASGSEAIYYYHFDGLGSVTELTNSSGQVIEYYTYDIFGSVIIKDGNGNVLSQSAVGNPYYFTARQLDPETGLYYYRARYYSSLIGRFLQTDPVGYSAGINLYTYCGNNPVNFVDPTGKLAILRALKNKATVTIITTSGKKIVIVASSAADIVKAIEQVKENGEKIKVFDYVGHGFENGGGLYMANGSLVTNDSDKEKGDISFNDIKDIIRDAFALDAEVRLGACQSAAGNNSIAKKFADLLPKANVSGYTGTAKPALIGGGTFPEWWTGSRRITVK